MSYTFSSSGKNVCHKCGKTAFMLEGTAAFLETEVAPRCVSQPCGLAGPREDTTDDDPAFIMLWTKLTGSAPRPYED